MKKISKFQHVEILLHILILTALAVNLYFVISLQGGQAKQRTASFDDLEITLITTPDCKTCFPLEPFREYFLDNGVKESQIDEKGYDSFSGRRLVNKYKITSVPTVVVTGNVQAYDFMVGLIENVGEIRDGALVVTKLQPPFLDLKTDEVRGEFELVYVDDSSCAECYDIALHDDVLDRLGLQPSHSTTVDISSEEGKLLVEEYALSAVPTILLRGDLEPYDTIRQLWPDVGTIEEDGTYVLRGGVASMGAYKVLPEGEIITPPPQDEVL